MKSFNQSFQVFEHVLANEGSLSDEYKNKIFQNLSAEKAMYLNNYCDNLLSHTKKTGASMQALFCCRMAVEKVIDHIIEDAQTTTVTQCPDCGEYNILCRRSCYVRSQYRIVYGDILVG